MEEVFEMAKQLQDAGLYEKAEECYRRYLEDHADSFKALNNLGIVLERQNKLGEAVASFRAATQLVPEETIPRYNLGHAYYRQERYESAASQFELVLEQAPDHGAAQMNLATIHWRRGELVDAEQRLRAARELPEVAASASSKLGLLLFELGRYDEARACHLAAADADGSPEHYFNAGLCDKLVGDNAAAAAQFERAVRLDPTSRIAHEHRARALHSAGQTEQAEQALAEWASAVPDDPVHEHMRAAFTGDRARDRCSPAYLSAAFGAFAGDFEKTLQRLEYAAPTTIGARLDETLDADADLLRILDAGCGTGVCASLLRPRASTLVGVDLAAPMLDRAREREDYDDLVEADLVDYLRDKRAAFDLIVAADTFNYFGTLNEILPAAGAALGASGRLLFTLEQATGDTQDYMLMPHGRFQHNRDYVERTLAAAGFAATSFDAFVLRRETGRDVHAWLIDTQRG